MRSGLLALALALVLLAVPAAGAVTVSQHPFAPSSPWNTALPAGVQYADAPCDTSLRDTSRLPWINAGSYSVPVYQASNSDPALHLFLNGAYMGTPRVPVAAAPSAGTDATLALVEPDGVHSDETWKTSINRAAGTMSSGAAARWDLNGTGVGGTAMVGAGPRASDISGLAGLIRSSELASGSIDHALALAVPTGDMARGWLWPADAEDQGAVEQTYAGNVHMGQLVSIPATVDVSGLGLSPGGLAIATALQRYGAYVVDSGGALALYAEPALESKLAAARTDMTKLRAAMRCAAVPPATASYPAAVQSDHPLAYYRLDDRSGTRLASAAGVGVDASLAGTPLFAQASALVGGTVGSALTFTGLQWASIPAVPRQSFSIEMWLKTTETAGTTPATWWTGEALVDADATGVAADYGTALAAGKVAFHVGDTARKTDVTIASTSNVNDGAWHQVVATRDGLTGALALYVDGKQQASSAGPLGRRFSPKTLALGSLASTPWAFFKGSLDEVAIYNQPLSAAAVARHFAARAAS